MIANKPTIKINPTQSHSTYPTQNKYSKSTIARSTLSFLGPRPKWSCTAGTGITSPTAATVAPHILCLGVMVPFHLFSYILPGCHVPVQDSAIAILTENTNHNGGIMVSNYKHKTARQQRPLHPLRRTRWLYYNSTRAYRYTTAFITPRCGGLSNLDCSTTKRVPAPNDTSSESSRRHVSNAGLFGTGTTPTVEIASMEHRPRGG